MARSACAEMDSNVHSYNHPQPSTTMHKEQKHDKSRCPACERKFGITLWKKKCSQCLIKFCSDCTEEKLDNMRLCFLCHFIGLSNMNFSYEHVRGKVAFSHLRGRVRDSFGEACGVEEHLWGRLLGKTDPCAKSCLKTSRSATVDPADQAPPPPPPPRSTKPTKSSLKTPDQNSATADPTEEPATPREVEKMMAQRAHRKNMKFLEKQAKKIQQQQQTTNNDDIRQRESDRSTEQSNCRGDGASDLNTSAPDPED
eukprot:gene19962-7067_t